MNSLNSSLRAQYCSSVGRTCGPYRTLIKRCGLQALYKRVVEDNDQFLLSSQYISIEHVYTLLAAEQKLKSWDGGPVPIPTF